MCYVNRMLDLHSGLSNVVCKPHYTAQAAVEVITGGLFRPKNICVYK